VEIVKKTCYTIEVWNIFTQRLKGPVLGRYLMNNDLGIKV